MERLQKLMARAGVASRRRCEELIVAGAVKVNGKIITRPGTLIDPAVDKIEVNGHPVEKTGGKVYLILYKPRGCVTTLHDPQGRYKVADLVKDVPQRVYPVGRLDYDSEGLLLLTNDGQLAYSLTHPRHQVPKTYLAWVTGAPSMGKINQMAEGLMLSDGLTSPAMVYVRRKLRHGTLLEITIHEGRKRQIRRMCKHIGHPVYRLKRISLGFLTLQGLKPGEYRPLTREEVQQLKKWQAICLKKKSSQQEISLFQRKS
ncbi:MAG TPA: pseudouridine synthase [Desulfotomaculum sp.]|jgi:23S rRNA pseudouridine2605 synthase/16S rRNA pseudouridine516 synthase|nr:pseudouridine synthase [Desulfotomaculum sp.]